MEISIITPIFNGNKYLNKYLKNISEACKNVKGIEVIWVNDSPNIKLEYNSELVKNFKLIIIENERNMGIHKSRSIGIERANGKYILFLDQDDEITKDALINNQKLLEKEPDMILGNGLYEEDKELIKIYKNNFSQRFASKKTPNIWARCFIISPGQCMIKKESIPKQWLESTLKINGTDDYLLWLLMFNKRAKILCNYNIVYIHKYTGENLSLNIDKMFKSQKELVEILRTDEEYNRHDLKKLEKAILYKYNYKRNFIKETIKNLDIFLYNVYYRIIWRGYIRKQ